MSLPASRSPLVLTLGLVALALVLAFGAAGSRPSAAEDPARASQLAYLHVSGEGPQAKAWYDGGPPAGTLVQAAINHFTAQGYRFAAIEAAGAAAVQQVVTQGPIPATPPREPSFVILLAK